MKSAQQWLQEGNKKYAQGDFKGAIAAYHNIQRKDSPELYAGAQVNLGVTLSQQGDPDGEIAAYRNIRREDSKEAYAQAQLNLGETLYQQGNIEETIGAYRNILNDKYFEAQSAIKALIDNKKYRVNLMEIRKVILDFMKELLIFSESEFELKVAHYT